MDLKIWLIFAVAIVVIILGILTIVLNLKPNKKSIDYRALFVVGIIWFVVGIILGKIILGTYMFSVIGLLFALIGLIQKGKWKENKKDWNKLSESEKRLVLVMIVVLGLLVLAGVIVLLLIQKGIIG